MAERRESIGADKNGQQQLDLRAPSSLGRLPSPKRVAADTVARRHLPWEGNYAAYSPTFAQAAIKYLVGGRAARVLDPFAGNGTTLEAAANVGIPATAIELNPYSALLCRCRVAFKAELDRVTVLLRSACRKSRVRSPGEEPSVRSEAMLSMLSERLACGIPEVIRHLCLVEDGSLDTEVVALTALLHIQRARARVHIRSNPAWLMEGASPERLEQGEVASIYEDAAAIAEVMVGDLVTRANGPARIAVHVGDFMRAPIRAGSVSRFLTSPPYLNRLDYVNPTLPVLGSIGVEERVGVEALRAQMMGTTKMRKSSSAGSVQASVVVREFLARVAAHKSKASATYYYRFFQQYFDDLHSFLAWLALRTTSSAVGLLVIQDSYYKEIPVPVLQIVDELAGAADFRVAVVGQESRARHMGTINPHQRGYVPRKALTEYVLQLSRTKASRRP